MFHRKRSRQTQMQTRTRTRTRMPKPDQAVTRSASPPLARCLSSTLPGSRAVGTAMTPSIRMAPTTSRQLRCRLRPFEILTPRSSQRQAKGPVMRKTHPCMHWKARTSHPSMSRPAHNRCQCCMTSEPCTVVIASLRHSYDCWCWHRMNRRLTCHSMADQWRCSCTRHGQKNSHCTRPLQSRAAGPWFAALRWSIPATTRGSTPTQLEHAQPAVLC